MVTFHLMMVLDLLAVCSVPFWNHSISVGSWKVSGAVPFKGRVKILCLEPYKMLWILEVMGE